MLLAAVAQPLRRLFLVRPHPQPLRSVLTEPPSQETILSEKDENQSSTARRGSTKTSIRFSSAGEHSDRNQLLRSILDVWRADLRFLTHGVRAPSMTEDADNLSRVILAVVGLLDEPNHASVRSAASRTLLALDQSDENDVGGARDGVFEVSA